MRVFHLLFLILLVCSKDVDGQSTSYISRNTVYMALNTRGTLYSLQYDRVLRSKGLLKNSVSAGFSIYDNVLAVPLGLHFFTGQQSNHFEFGVMFIPFAENYTELFSAGSQSDKKGYIIPELGYRYQQPLGGFFFKITAGPYILLDPPENNFWKMDTKFFAGISAGTGFSF